MTWAESTQSQQSNNGFSDHPFGFADLRGGRDRRSRFSNQTTKRIFMDNPVNRRTVAIELAYNYRKGQLQKENEGDYSPHNDLESKAREWAEQNHMAFEEEAEYLIVKLESPL